MRMNSQQAAMATALSQSPAIQEVQTRLQQLESELTLARTRFTDSNPAVRDLEQRVDSLRRSLRQRSRRLTGSGELNGNLVGGFQQRLTEELVRLESNRLGLARQIATLSSAQELYRQRARQLPFLEQQQRQLERKLETSQSTYSLLLQKLQEIRVAENQNTDNVRVLAMAPVPATPVAPRKSLFMVTGLLLGSLLGLATALVLEALDKSIKTVEATKATFGFDLLGVIPLLDQPHKVLPQFDIKPNEAIHESYWMVTSNLLNAKADPRVIVVTSAVPSEGKSTVAANLSAAIAQSGRKVLLIDADLQQPTQHHIWQLPNRLGLSNVLQDKIELRTAIHEITPALDTLFSGATTSAPSALLSSQEMAALIEDLASWYEFIIIDTSPLNMAAGAAALGQLADGIVLVARPGIVDATSAAITRELLEQSGQNVLGMIINGIAADQQPYAIYSYAYNRRDRQPPPQRLALPWRLSRDSAMPIAPIVSLPEQISLDQPIDTKVLESIPSTKLQEIVEELQASLEQLLNFVEQEEEELQSEHQTIKTIRQKINTTDEYERFGLELELAYEQERQELLSESLVGQRSNLQRRQELLNQCLQVMHKRKVKRMSLKVKRSAS
jgi:capsular exopolysaccharide synthesis family protein